MTALVWAVSSSRLIFSGSLAEYASVGIKLALVSNIVVGFFFASRTSLPGLVTSVQEAPVAILSVIASGIVADSSIPSAEAKLFTVVAAAICTGILSGMAFLGLGMFRLGSLARYVPYPVIGGFLAGVGWLLVASAIASRSGVPLALERLEALFALPALAHWLPELLFGVLLVWALRHTRHFLALPSLIAIATLGFYLFLWGTGTSLAEARLQGWLLEPWQPESLGNSLTLFHLRDVNWLAIAKYLPQLLSIIPLSILGVLLNTSGIEVALHKDIGLNHELKVTGIANILAGLTGGGLTSYVSLSRSVLNYQLGADSRAVGWLASGLCALALFGGLSILSLFPQLLIGGLTIFLGLNFLMEWLYDGWFNLTKSDYYLVWLIVLSIACWGLLPGVVVGMSVSMILFVINTSQFSVIKQIFSSVNYPSHVQRSPRERFLLQENGQQVYLVQLQGWLFFGTAHQLFNHIRDRLNRPAAQAIRFIVLDFRLVNGLDSSAIASFIKLKQMIPHWQTYLIFSDLKSHTLQKLQEKGCLAGKFIKVFEDVNQGLAWCENEILTSYPLKKRDCSSLEAQLFHHFLPAIKALKLTKYLSEIQLAPGDFLFCQGQAADGMYFLESGQVSVIRQYNEKQQKCLRIYTSETTIGEVGLYKQAVRSASVVADLPSSLYFLSLQAFKKMEIESPELASEIHKLIIQSLMERLHYREQEMHNLLD